MSKTEMVEVKTHSKDFARDESKGKQMQIRYTEIKSGEKVEIAM